MDFSILFAVYGAFVVGLISPGPDLVLVSAMAMKHGKRAAVLASLGIGIGVGLWVEAAAAGLSGLANSAPEVWEGARLLAGGVLIYVGARSLSAAIRGQSGPPKETERLGGSPLWIGLITNLANPKAAVVLVGLTAVLNDAVPDQYTLMAVVLGMPVLAIAWFVAISTLLSRAGVRIYLLKRQRLIDFAVGIAFAGVGAILIQATP